MLLRSSLVFALITTFAAVGSAQEPASVQALMDEIDEEVAQLDTSDCTAACVALESMRRAAQRVCDLEPGDACQKARDKVEEARKKVSAACPDCAAAKATSLTEETKPEPAPEPALDAEPEAPSGGPGRDVSPAAPPPSEDDSGGCASCTVGRGGSSDVAWWIAAGLAVGALRRRRRQSD